MQKKGCQFWTSYWGLLAVEDIGQSKFEIHGLENISSQNQSRSSAAFNVSGTLWGFTQSGKIEITSGDNQWSVKPLQWFCLPFQSHAEIRLAPSSRAFFIFHPGHRGLSSMGGPVESEGRLKYIDGCTDTVLYCPPVVGDPCMNLLHFPKGVDQTEHFHPSFRSGIVCRGEGTCVSAKSEPLREGMIFLLPANTRHKFRTDSNAMDVISFHPDSDWGPAHENHPMINRTWGTDGSDKR